MTRRKLNKAEPQNSLRRLTRVRTEIIAIWGEIGFFSFFYVFFVWMLVFGLKMGFVCQLAGLGQDR